MMFGGVAAAASDESKTRTSVQRSFMGRANAACGGLLQEKAL